MPETATPDGPRVRARRLALGLAGLALLVTASGFAISVGRGSGDHIIPWVDHPVPRPSVAPQVIAEPRPRQAPCREQDLELLWPEQGSTITDTTGGSDSTGFAVLVRNVGAQACTLSGHPRAQGVDRDGEPVGQPALAGVYLPSRRNSPGAATIQPGEPARFFLSMSSRGCTGPRLTYYGAQLVLDNGFRFTIENAWLSGVCPLKVSAWEPVVNEARRFWALEARILAPSSAEAGGELRYRLDLVNVTASVVRFDPCLIFTHAIGPEADFDPAEIDELPHSTHRLNCSVKTIGPRAVARYHMRFVIPSDFPPGRTVLYWTAESDGNPAASTALIVDSATGPPGLPND